MKVTATLLLAAALGASAHPSGHAHKHAHRSALEERSNFVMANRPPPPETTTTSIAPVPTTTSIVPAPQPTTSSSSSPEASPTSGSGGSSGGSSGTFCSGKKMKRATAAEIAYTGNVGSDGDYGCNLKTIDSGDVDSYKHVMTFENDGGKDQSCACWLKIGPDGGINGFFKGNQAINFDLPANGKAYVAADDNTQGGCACGSGSVPLTSIGEFASTWVEYDFDNESNDGWSGADASCLVAAAAGLDIPGLQVCGSGTCSTIYAGGKGDNAYTGGMEAEDGVGLNLSPGNTRLTVKVNYSG